MDYEALATGYYLEALAVAEEGVWFSDVVQGGIIRRSADGRLQTWLADRRWIGSILINHDGRILASGPGGIAWVDPESGASGMLLEAIDGQPIDGVNEMTPDGKGGIYFGTVDLPAIVNGRAPGPAALYRLDIEGRVSRLCSGLKFSNGLGLSPDGRRLYHNESFVGTFAYDVAPDGSLGPAVPLLEKYDCDGLAVDRDGGIWISGFGSNEIVRLRPDGSVDGRIAVPAPAATNVRFGGTDMRDLYVTTVLPEAATALARGTAIEAPSSVLYRARSEIAGLPLEATHFRV